MGGVLTLRSSRGEEATRLLQSCRDAAAMRGDETEAKTALRNYLPARIRPIVEGA